MKIDDYKDEMMKALGISIENADWERFKELEKVSLAEDVATFLGWTDNYQVRFVNWSDILAGVDKENDQIYPVTLFEFRYLVNYVQDNLACDITINQLIERAWSEVLDLREKFKAMYGGNI